MNDAEMTLQEAIEEVKRETIGDEFEAYEFYDVASTNVTAEAISNILNAVVKGELAPVAKSDSRPEGCRFRLQDEGKPYPRSSCKACGKGVMTGLGTVCGRTNQ